MDGHIAFGNLVTSRRMRHGDMRSNERTFSSFTRVLAGLVLTLSSGKAKTRPKIVWWWSSGETAQIKLFLYWRKSRACQITSLSRPLHHSQSQMLPRQLESIPNVQNDHIAGLKQFMGAMFNTDKIEQKSLKTVARHTAVEIPTKRFDEGLHWTSRNKSILSVPFLTMCVAYNFTSYLCLSGVKWHKHTRFRERECWTKAKMTREREKEKEIYYVLCSTCT